MLRLAVIGAALALAAPAAGSAPVVHGRAWFVQNSLDGAVLTQHDSRLEVPMASITKLMTVLVTLEHAKLTDVVAVSAHAAAVGESTINLHPGEQLTVRELIEAALIQSANDAAVALADYVGNGSQAAFVDLMNAKARQLHLTETHFQNPDGLDADGHYSSARDLTRLARVAMRNPFVRATVRRSEASISGHRVLHTWNDLLATFPHLLGVKTGHTDKAGWSEVAAAQGLGVTVYATLLGEPTRAQRNDDLAQLLEWGLSRYRVVPVISAHRAYASARAPYGRGEVALVALRQVVLPERIDRTLLQRVVAPAWLHLPVRAGQPIGEVQVYAGTRVVARSPLVAARSVGQPGFIGKARWYAGRALHHVWGWLS